MLLSLRHLAESTALIASKATLLIESRLGMPEARLQTYWMSCRSRTLDWIKQLDTLNCQFNDEPTERHRELWSQAEPLLQEIFVSEILTRVWAGILTASDQTKNQKLAGPIARHTMTAHIDVRNRAMALMLGGPQISLAELARVDRIRRKAERWSDLLISSLVTRYRLEELTFDLQRAVDFANGQMHEVLKATEEPVWEFIRAGVHLAFASLETPCQPPQAAILKCVLSSLPADLFDDYGQPKSSLQVRVERPIDERSPFRIANQVAEVPSRRLNFAALRTRQSHD